MGDRSDGEVRCADRRRCSGLRLPHHIGNGNGDRRAERTDEVPRSARILAFGQPWGQGKRRGVVDALDTEDDDDPERFKVLVVEEV